MSGVTFSLNGVGIRASSEKPSETLLSFLRERMGLTGTKKACGKGHCGSCTVIVDGKARRSCTLKISGLMGARVDTIEGLGRDGRLHPIQKAFLQTGAVQCGFCTPGMIMAAKALLDSAKNPTESQIKEALRNNICRCTGYRRIVDAIKLAARWLEQGGQEAVFSHEGGIGKVVVDIEGEAKVAGKLLFADDYRNEPFLVGRIVWSDYPHARIIGIESGPARDIPGVKAVIKASDIPGRNGIGFTKFDQPVFAHDTVRTIGDPLAAVFAETKGQADDACKAVRIEYEPLPVVSSPVDALDARSVHLYPGGNLLKQF